MGYPFTSTFSNLMPELKHATLLVAGSPAASSPRRPAAAVAQTQVLRQAQWRQLLIQTHREPGTIAPTRMQPVPEVQLILRRVGVSKMTLTAGEQVRGFQPRPGDLFLTAPHQPAYEMQRESLCGRPVQNTHLYQSQQLLTQAAAETLGVDAARVELREGSCLRDPLLKQLTLSLGQELTRPAAGSALFAETAAQLVAAQLLRQHCTVHYRLPEQTGKLVPAVLRQLTAYIEERLAEPLTLQELAHLACLSSYHFCRLFKNTTGLSPNQYVIARRLHQARRLLRAGQSTAQVALAVGYADPRHFARLFRRHVGCTPADYRSQRV